MAAEHVVDLLIAPSYQSCSSADWNIDVYWQHRSHVETRHSSPVSLSLSLFFALDVCVFHRRRQSRPTPKTERHQIAASVDTATRADQ